MHIHKVTLKNYKPFYNIQEVELRTDSDSPLVLIGAKNDRGKSAFFSGVKFCLYGFDGNNPQKAAKRRNAVNRRAFRERAGETYVQIQFEHDDDAYTVTRYITFTPGFSNEEEIEIGRCYPEIERNGDFIIDEDDSTEDYHETLNTILPENASKFFFFDAEADLKKYTQSSEDVRNAIETVLGIQEIRDAVHDLERQEESFKRDFLSARTDADNRQRLKGKLEDLSEERAALEDRKERKERKLELQEERLESIEEEIEEIQEVAEKRQELRDIERRIEDTDSDRLRAEKRLNRILRRAGPILAGIGARQVPKYDRSEVDQHLEAVITDIMENDTFDGKCICGRDLTPKHLNTLENRIGHDAPAQEPFHLAIQRLKSDLPSDIEEIRRRYTEQREERDEKRRRIESLREQKGALEEEIDAITEEDDQELKRRRDEAKEQIQSLKKKIEKLQKQILRKENEEEQKQKRIQSLGGATEDEKRLNKLWELSGRCADAMEEVRDDFVEKRRNEVQGEASRVFKRLTNKPDVYEGLVLDEDYNLLIKTESGLRDVETQSPSAGQTQIIAYSFIAGLNNYTAREAPVIIDTPLGRLDPIHKDRLIGYYPQFSNQVVILYQPSELSPGDTDVMSRSTSRHLMIRAREEDPETSEFASIDQDHLRSE